MAEENDFLEGLNEATNLVGNNETTSNEFQGASGQKGLDYSTLDYDVVIFKPADDGENNKFDIIPFVVKEDWYPDLLYPPPTQIQKDAGQKYAKTRGIKPGQAEICLEIPFHRYADGDSGDVVCLREAFAKKCPHCDLMFKLYKKANEEGDPTAKVKAGELKTSWRTFFNIYNHLTDSGTDDGHDGYEVIDDMGRTTLKEHIDKRSKNTKLGENFVYPYPHPTKGYTLIAPSVFKAPTSKKYNKGFTEFPIINFEERAQGVDYTEDIYQSISFDTLVTPLIKTYEELEEILQRKMIKMEIKPDEPEDTYDTDKSGSESNYVGTTDGNGINDIPEQETGKTVSGEVINDNNAYDQTASSGRAGRRNRGSRTTESSPPADETKKTSEPPEDNPPASRRTRRPRR